MTKGGGRGINDNRTQKIMYQQTYFRRNKTILPTNIKIPLRATNLFQQICVNKFVQGQNFWKMSALSEFGIHSGHFFVKLHKFVEFPDFSAKNRPAQGDYKLEVLTQHIFVDQATKI